MTSPTPFVNPLDRVSVARALLEQMLADDLPDDIPTLQKMVTDARRIQRLAASIERRDRLVTAHMLLDGMTPEQQAELLKPSKRRP